MSVVSWGKREAYTRLPTTTIAARNAAPVTREHTSISGRGIKALSVGRSLTSFTSSPAGTRGAHTRDDGTAPLSNIEYRICTYRMRCEITRGNDSTPESVAHHQSAAAPPPAHSDRPASTNSPRSSRDERALAQLDLSAVSEAGDEQTITHIRRGTTSDRLQAD
jgi:hypothetical protein